MLGSRPLFLIPCMLRGSAAMSKRSVLIRGNFSIFLIVPKLILLKIFDPQSRFRPTAAAGTVRLRLSSQSSFVVFVRDGHFETTTNRLTAAWLDDRPEHESGLQGRSSQSRGQSRESRRGPSVWHCQCPPGIESSESRSRVFSCVRN